MEWERKRYEKVFVSEFVGVLFELKERKKNTRPRSFFGTFKKRLKWVLDYKSGRGTEGVFSTGDVCKGYKKLKLVLEGYNCWEGKRAQPGDRALLPRDKHTLIQIETELYKSVSILQEVTAYRPRPLGFVYGSLPIKR